MTTQTNLPLQTNSPLKQKQQADCASCYVLKWRQGQLLVKSSQQSKQIYTPPPESKQRLADCLKHSPIHLIRIEQALGEATLKLWADASEQANKKVFIRIPSNHEFFGKQGFFGWILKRLIDWSAAALLLLALSPLMLFLALVMRIYSPGPIFFQQWRVGKRGQLFRIIKFRTMMLDAEKLHHQVMADQRGLHKLKNDPRITPLGSWMRKYSLDELPQLFNVLRGEMSLVGPRPWALYDALRISQDGQKRLNALPGITGPWQIEARSNLLDLDEVNELDLNYLRNWSLGRDLQILLLTVPKVLFGFGAC